MYKANILERLEHNNRWIGWTFFLDLIDGLSLTLRYMFSKSITMQYPDKEKWVPYPRHRGHHFLRVDEEGENKCVGCELCAIICPCDCITVIPYEDEKGNRRPLVYDVDMARCLYCGLCEDACPTEAIALGRGYEYSAYNVQELVVGRDALLNTPGKMEEGGSVVKANFVKGEDEGIDVKAKEAVGYHWWKHIQRE